MNDEPAGGQRNRRQRAPGGISRRELFTRVSVAGGGVIAVLLAVPVVGYLLGPLFDNTPNNWLDLGPLSDFPEGETREAQFSDPSSLPWAGDTAQTAVWVRRGNGDDFTIFALNCTHLGCPVSWLAGARLFLCPCHGGVYNGDGTVAGGPPPRSLFTYKSRVRNGRLEALSRSLPTV